MRELNLFDNDNSHLDGYSHYQSIAEQHEKEGAATLAQQRITADPAEQSKISSWLKERFDMATINPPLILDDLRKPFHEDDIEWRIGECGKTRDGKVWAKCLAYLTNRAIMNRLDEIVGPGLWWNEYKAGPQGGVLCGITIRVDGLAVTKWDGAENTDIEQVKGGLSDAMKRAAVQWGIGRYLYDLPKQQWADVLDKKEDGANFARLPEKVSKDRESFWWFPPKLPYWAVPAKGAKAPSEGPEADPVKPTPNDAAKKAAKPEANGNGPTFVPDAPPPAKHDKPGDEMVPSERYTKGMTAIVAAKDEKMLAKIDASIDPYVEAGEMTAQQANAMRRAMESRRKGLGLEATHAQ